MSNKLSEDAIQSAIIEWLKYYPHISPYILHFPNEGKRTKAYGARLKRMGLRKGASDLFLALPRKGYHGFFLELKTETGRPTIEQKEFLQTMQQEKYFTYISHGLDDAMAIIKWYCDLA